MKILNWTIENTREKEFDMGKVVAEASEEGKECGRIEVNGKFAYWISYDFLRKLRRSDLWPEVGKPAAFRENILKFDRDRATLRTEFNRDYRAYCVTDVFYTQDHDLDSRLKDFLGYLIEISKEREEEKYTISVTAF